MNEHEKYFAQTLLQLTMIIEELAEYKDVAKPNHTLALLTLSEGIRVVIKALEEQLDRESNIEYLERLFAQ